MYSEVGRPSTPPERLLKASLLMALYTVRSERLFCEQLDYNLLFRWFLDLNWDEPAFDHSTFSRNRMRLLEHDVAGEFFRTVVSEARELRLTSDEHFTVDGTLIEAWASLKSLRPKGEQPTDRTPPDDPGILAWTSTASDARTRPGGRPDSQVDHDAIAILHQSLAGSKTVGNFRRTRYRGVERTSCAAYLVAAAYNLLRIAKLCPTG
jgi:transposase